MLYVYLLGLFCGSYLFSAAYKPQHIAKPLLQGPTVMVQRRVEAGKSIGRTLQGIVKQTKHIAQNQQKSSHAKTRTKLSWVAAPIITLFNKTYKIALSSFYDVYNAYVLPFVDRKKYDALISEQKQLFEQLVNDQAIFAFNKILTIITNEKQLLKKGSLYQLTTYQALEGGALLAKDLAFDVRLTQLLVRLNMHLLDEIGYASYDTQGLQAIYEMNSVLKEAKQLMKSRGGIDKFAMYDADAIDLLIRKQATVRNITLTSGASYADYLTKWINTTSNTKKAMAILVSIGALYIFGSFLPASVGYYLQYPVNTIKRGVDALVSKVLPASRKHMEDEDEWIARQIRVDQAHANLKEEEKEKEFLETLRLGIIDAIEKNQDADERVDLERITNSSIKAIKKHVNDPYQIAQTEKNKANLEQFQSEAMYEEPDMVEEGD